MFNHGRPYRFHIELTDKCNAGCPMCARTDPLNFCKADKTRVRKIELSLEDFKQSFTPDFCAAVEEVDLCGTYGDPIAASQCLEICEYLADHDINIIISTNGGLRNVRWWERLGRALGKTGSKIELHVDGLADTNGLYRINTNFDRIIENIEAYLATGAAAEWNYLLFKHNEHQVIAARDLASQMGFDRFVLIDTVRFGSGASFRYQMPDGEYRRLEPSSKSAADFALDVAGRNGTGGKGTGGNGSQSGTETSDDRSVNGINCKAEIRNRVYIDAAGNVAACCWISGSDEEQELKNQSGHPARDYNIRNRPLAEIMLGEPFRSLYRQDWLDGGNRICRRKCGEMRRNKRLAI